jgi:hypothetical protein
MRACAVTSHSEPPPLRRASRPPIDQIRFLAEMRLVSSWHSPYDSVLLELASEVTNAALHSRRPRWVTGRPARTQTGAAASTQKALLRPHRSPPQKAYFSNFFSTRVRNALRFFEVGCRCARGLCSTRPVMGPKKGGVLGPPPPRRLSVRPRRAALCPWRRQARLPSCAYPYRP